MTYSIRDVYTYCMGGNLQIIVKVWDIYNGNIEIIHCTIKIYIQQRRN